MARMSLNQASESETPECYFWKLPQELQDTIFHLAYSRKSAYRLTNKKAFKDKQDQQERKTKDRLPFSPLKIEDFLNGLFASYARHVESAADTSDLEVLRSYRNLRVMKLRVDEPSFYADDDDEDKYLRLEILTPKDFSKQIVVQDLVRLRLDDFKLSKKSFNACKHHPSDQSKIWKTNLMALEAYVESFVLQDRDASYILEKTSVTSGPTPLYLGSRVCFGTSALLLGDYYERYAPFAIAYKYRAAQKSPTKPDTPSTKTKLVEEPAPQTTEELLQRLNMTPQQVWTAMQKMKMLTGGTKGFIPQTKRPP